MKSLGSIGSLLWALVLVLLAIIGTVNSFKQELWFYDAQGDDVHFQSNVADTTPYSLLLSQVTRVCTKGAWFLFGRANFLDNTDFFGALNNTSVVCNDFTRGASVKSLRHLGAIDTDTDAISLYEEEHHAGKEIFVTARVHTGITNEIRTIAITGTSDWMLFEGQDLDGQSRCYQVPHPVGSNYDDHVISLNMVTVGSVFKGCDVNEINKYKLLRKSL